MSTEHERALRAERRRRDVDRWFRGGVGHKVIKYQGSYAPVPAVTRDSRSLTGRICGDPLPGRSALDKKAELSPLSSPTFTIQVVEALGESRADR
jgi:hypothetical protein